MATVGSWRSTSSVNIGFVNIGLVNMGFVNIGPSLLLCLAVRAMLTRMDPSFLSRDIGFVCIGFEKHDLLLSHY